MTETLQFTHGYGFVMNPVNEVAPNGQPRFLVELAPAAGPGPALLPRAPQIYYGEFTREPVIAPSAMPELDYSLEDGNHTSRFAGRAGLPLRSWASRALFSLHLRDANLVLSRQITPASQLLIRRRIDTGRRGLRRSLGSTTTPIWSPPATGSTGSRTPTPFRTTSPTVSRSRMPAPLRRMTAAGLAAARIAAASTTLRNSVKVVVDAYSGQTDFYVFDAG